MKKLLYIDLFCGAGGTSTGVEAARLHGEKCAHVLACVNHDPNAIKSHAANHPDAIHFTEDIRTLETTPLTDIVNKARRADPDALVVLWASLECTNFSKAKGGLPRDADSRTLPEKTVFCAASDKIRDNIERLVSDGVLEAVDNYGKQNETDNSSDPQ